MVLVCHENRNGSTRVITNKRGGHPPLVLEGYHLGNPTLHLPPKGKCCFRWYVTTPRWSMHPDNEGLHRLKRVMFTFLVPPTCLHQSLPSTTRFMVPPTCLHQSLPSITRFMVPKNCLYQQSYSTSSFLVLIKTLYQYFNTTNGPVVLMVSLC